MFANSLCLVEDMICFQTLTLNWPSYNLSASFTGNVLYAPRCNSGSYQEPLPSDICTCFSNSSRVEHKIRSNASPRFSFPRMNLPAARSSGVTVASAGTWQRIQLEEAHHDTITQSRSCTMVNALKSAFLQNRLQF